MERLEGAAEYILGKAKALGADMAQCSVSESKTTEFNMDGGEFSLMRTMYDYSVSITVFKDKRRGQVAVNTLDESKLDEAVILAIESCGSGKEDDAWEICSDAAEMDFVDGCLEPDREKLFERTEELARDIAERHPKILINQLVDVHSLGQTVYANSYGVKYRSRKGYYGLTLMYVARDGEKTTSIAGCGFTMKDLDKPFIELGVLDSNLDDTEKQLNTNTVNGKFVGTVVMKPDCVANMVAVIRGNFLSDSVMIDGSSIWRDKLGEKVADESISIRVAPKDSRIVCGQSYTGEGYLSEDFDLIRDGVLTSFDISQYVANKCEQMRAANSSGAIVIKPGEKTLDEIISGVDHGILMGGFSGGQPAPSGEFSGVAKNSFLIENGKVTTALTETMVSGNIADMLHSVVGVSSETQEDGESSVPYVAFGGVTISGGTVE